MKIRMLVGLSGNAYSLGPGDERDFPDAEALRLVAAEFAVPVADARVERAVADRAPERRGKRTDVVSNDGNGSAD
ncbi:hypothetical protein [Mesorhizobium sp. ESP-6-2]|uniref:hypothetical protein n=1 Tax=Mesorhizobium sp. ESP-6-2 TaxID=2876625 RepID=UPI001CD02A16|nr:hypothetical protein [Mesorhizobium sp. ESP-6-2]MBZ9808135.1 hypothetical protein [Mesorhizobium sp. ESP-6-2]